MSKKILSVFLCIIMLFASLCVATPAFAETLVNGVSVNSGDTLTYAIHLKPLEKKLAAFNLKITYDSTVLSVAKEGADDYKLTTPAFEGKSVSNCKVAGTIFVNALDGINGFGITEDVEMVNVTFDVISDSANCDISYEMLEIFDLDIQTIDSVEYTYALASAKSATSSKVQPVVTSSEESSSVVSNAAPEQTGSNSKLDAPLVGSSDSDDEFEKIDDARSTISSSSKAVSNKEKSNNVIWVILGVVAVLVIGIIVTAIVKSVNKKKTNSNNKTNKKEKK